MSGSLGSAIGPSHRKKPTGDGLLLALPSRARTSALLQDVAGQNIKIKLRRYPQMSAIIQDCVNQSRLTHANFRRSRPGNMVWRIVPVNTIR
jgi:hypothetical protein